MYLAYIDESGVSHAGSGEGRFFVLSAVITHDKHWQEIDSKAIQIKLKYFPEKDPDTLEFKMHHIWQGKNQYNKMHMDAKNKYLHEIFSLFSDASLTVVSTAVRKEECAKRYSNSDMVEICWQNLLEQIEMFLTDRGDNGLLVMDSQNLKADDKIRKGVKSIIRSKTSRATVNHVIEDIFFTRSEVRNLIQMADVAAFCTRQHMRDDVDNRPYWKMLEKGLYKDGQGNYDTAGLRIIPED